MVYVLSAGNVLGKNAQGEIWTTISLMLQW